MFGFLNIYKPSGITSFDVIARLRRISHIRQIGHTGTLDPFAQGVLPVCIGKATKLIEYLPNDKAYLATVQFGAKTDTYDLDGKILWKSDKKTTENEILKGLNFFAGEIKQFPPIYSAIKVNGKKLYDYARDGKSVDIEPRTVTIYKTELKSFDEEKQIAQIYIECSKGTYIRSIANDLGEHLGTGAYLSALVRTKSGKFNRENSIKLENINSLEDIEKNLLNPVEYMELPIYNLDEYEKERVSHGVFIKNKNFNSVVILTYSDKIYAIGKADKNKIIVKKVFEVL